MKAAMYAIIKKDFRIVASNRRLFPALFIVPLVLTIVLPSIFVITIHFVPDDPDITKLLSLLPETARMESLELTLSGMILKLYTSDLFPDNSHNDCFYHGSQCICRRKGTAYA